MSRFGLILDFEALRFRMQQHTWLLTQNRGVKSRDYNLPKFNVVRSQYLNWGDYIAPSRPIKCVQGQRIKKLRSHRNLPCGLVEFVSK